MNLPARLLNKSQTILSKFGFECLTLLLLCFYTAFYLTPSSYGKALELLGIPKTGILLGKAQAVRSDEWSVWTPYLQALVNNHFERFNAYSIYHEDFRNFNALPIYDWALFFKPQFWSFLIAEPARAFSFHHGFLIAAFIIGWKQLVEKLFANYPLMSPSIAIGFSFILFFSGFVQTVWTTMGPIMAFFPWLMLVLLNWQRDTLCYYLLLCYVTAVWLLSHTYPPLVISLAYVGLYLLYIFQSNFFFNIRRLIFSLVAGGIGVAIVIYYFKDVIAIMMNTVYPGKRVSVGGEGYVYFWLSTIIPYITHSSDKTILSNLNFCEATTASSLLPLLCLCFSNVKNLNALRVKEVITLCWVFIGFTAWMLLPIPKIVGKLLLLSNVPEHRLAFLMGFTANLLALTVLVKFGAKITLKRLLIYSACLLFCWNLPALFGYFKYLEKSAYELITIPLLVICYGYYTHNKISHKTLLPFLISCAVIANVWYFGLFNPIQTANSIFSTKDNVRLNYFKSLEKTDSRGWLVFPVIPGAIFNGLGLKSFSHVLMQPQLKFFRTLFPELSDYDFNQTFNRYAHIELSDVEQPVSLKQDSIAIPFSRITENKASLKPEFKYTDCHINAMADGTLESIKLKNRQLYLSGWMVGNEHLFRTNLLTSKLKRYLERPRIDVGNVRPELAFEDLLHAGFSFEVSLSDDDLQLVKQQGFCLYSDSNKYGVKKLYHISAAEAKSILESK